MHLKCSRLENLGNTNFFTVIFMQNVSTDIFLSKCLPSLVDKPMDDASLSSAYH